MSDYKYKFDFSIPDAKTQREQVTQQGIGARPADEQEPMDKGFYESMYDAIVTYFDDAEEADRVLTAKEIDKDRVKGEVLREFDALDSLLSKDTETPSLDYFDGIDRDVMEDTVQAQADRIVDTAGATFEKPSGELIEGFKDVTDTEEGKLTNVKPLEELAEAIDPGTIDTSELPGKGLMSPRLDGKDGDLAESYDAMEMDAYLDEFIPEMAQLEGMGGDVVLGDLEPTYSYGITEQKANEYGMRPDQFETMEDFARAFAARYRQEKEDMYPDIFTSDLDKEVERGLQSYLWNRGSFYPGQLRALREGNFNGFINELKDVINAADRDAPNNQSRPMSGLSKRRAAEANLVGRGIEGYVPIATVETTGTQQRPIFIWRDAQGNELNRFAPQKQLHSQSTMGEVEVPQ